MNKFVVIFRQQSSVPVQHLFLHPCLFVGLEVGESVGFEVGEVGEKEGWLVGVEEEEGEVGVNVFGDFDGEDVRDVDGWVGEVVVIGARFLIVEDEDDMRWFDNRRRRISRIDDDDDDDGVKGDIILEDFVWC